MGNMSRHNKRVCDKTVGMNINELPKEVLTAILTNIPPRTLAITCMRVCKLWKEIIESKGFWIEASEHLYGRPLKSVTYRTILDLKRLCVHRPLERNLIKNHLALDGEKEWKVTASGGDGLIVENTPIGSDSLESVGFQKGSAKCWATSFGWGAKEQLVDLLKEGCNAALLDHCQPRITASEWVAGRFDCAAEYYMKITLLDHDKRPLQKESELLWSVDQWQGRAWHQEKLEIKDYGPGLRFILFKHGGKDKQFWAGHYGAKFTAATLILHLDHD